MWPDLAPPAWFDESADPAGWFDSESLAPDSGPPPSTITAVWTPPGGDQNWENYRYLLIRARSLTTSGGTLTVRVQHPDSGEDKTFTAKLGAVNVWTNLLFDLCRPLSMPSTVLTQESRWPLESPGGIPDDSDQHWGVNVVRTVEITVDGADAPVEIDHIRLRREEWGRASHLLALRPWQTAWTTTGVSTTYQKPTWWWDSDGRVADRAAVFKTIPISGPTTYTFLDIEDYLDAIQAPLGWVEGAGGALPADGYHTNLLEGLHLGGGGVRWDWAPGGGWVPEIDVDRRTVKAMIAQVRWHEVQGFPYQGNPWTGSAAYGDRIPLRTAKILGGQAWGLTMNAAAPTPGQLVRLETEPGLVSRGTGTSDARGFYITGAPFGQQGNHKVKTGALETATFALYSRMRHRRCFAVSVEAEGGVAYAVFPDQTHCRAYVVDGFVVTEVADNTLGWRDETQAFGAEYLSLAARRRGSREFILSSSETASVTWRYSSDALTWSAPVTIGAGSHSIAVPCSDGRVFSYRVSGGNIVGKEFDALGNQIGAEFTAVTGVDDVSFGGAESLTGRSNRRIVLQVTISGTVTQKISTDGRVFV